MSTANMEPPGPLINGLPNPTMKAIRVHSFGGPEVLTLEDSVCIPEVQDNQVGVFEDTKLLLESR